MMESDATTSAAPATPRQCPMGDAGLVPPSEGVIHLSRRPDGRLDLNPGEGPTDPHSSLGLRPVEHLAVALGGCLSEFAGRFLERRELPGVLEISIRWKVSVRQCAIDSLHVTLQLATRLDDTGRETLHRMLNLCPVHKALQGNVTVELEVFEGWHSGSG